MPVGGNSGNGLRIEKPACGGQPGIDVQLRTEPPHEERIGWRGLQAARQDSHFTAVPIHRHIHPGVLASGRQVRRQRDIAWTEASQRNQQRQPDRCGAAPGRQQADTARAEQHHRRQELEKIPGEESPSRGHRDQRQRQPAPPPPSIAASILEPKPHGADRHCGVKSQPAGRAHDGIAQRILDKGSRGVNAAPLPYLFVVRPQRLPAPQPRRHRQIRYREAGQQRRERSIAPQSARGLPRTRRRGSPSRRSMRSAPTRKSDAPRHCAAPCWLI